MQSAKPMSGSRAAKRSPYPGPIPTCRRSSSLLIGRHSEIALATGPFNALARCRRVLVIADVENLAYGGRDLGVTVDFGMLASRLKASLRDSALHAVFSAPPGDDRVAQLLTEMGWTPHQRQIIGRFANADVAIGFYTAALFARTKADACVMATGDGGLALDIAHGIRRTFDACSLIATMSLAGSTSRRLDARQTAHIDVNLEIGLDVMRVA